MFSIGEFQNLARWLVLFVKLFIIFLIVSIIIFLPGKPNVCYKADGNRVEEDLKYEILVDKSNVNKWIDAGIVFKDIVSMEVNGLFSYGERSINQYPDVKISDLLDISFEDNAILNNHFIVLNGKGIIADNQENAVPFLVSVRPSDILQIEVHQSFFSNNSYMKDIFGNNWQGDCSPGKVSYNAFCGHFSPWVGKAIVEGRCMNGYLLVATGYVSSPVVFSTALETDKRIMANICKDRPNGFFEVDDMHSWLNVFNAIRLRVVLESKKDVDLGKKTLLPWKYLSNLKEIEKVGDNRKVIARVEDLIGGGQYNLQDFKLFLEIGMFRLSGYDSIGGGVISLNMTNNTIDSKNLDGKILISHGKDEYEKMKNAVPMRRLDDGALDIPSSFTGKKIFLKVSTTDSPVLGEMVFTVKNTLAKDVDDRGLQQIKVGFVDMFLSPFIEKIRDIARMFISQNICNSSGCSIWVSITHVFLLLASVYYVTSAIFYQKYDIYDSLCFTLKIVIVVFIFSSHGFAVLEVMRQGILSFIGGVFTALFNVEYDENSLLSTILSPGIKFFDAVPYFLARATAYISAFPIGIMLLIVILFCIIALIFSFVDVVIVILLCYINIEIGFVLLPLLITFLLFEKTQHIVYKLEGVFLNSVIGIIFLGLGSYILFDIVLQVLDGMCNYSICMKNIYNIYILNFNWFVPWGYGGDAFYDKVYLDILNSGALIVLSVISGAYIKFLISNVDRMTVSFGGNMNMNVSSGMFKQVVNTINNPSLFMKDTMYKINSVYQNSGMRAAVNPMITKFKTEWGRKDTGRKEGEKEMKDEKGLKGEKGLKDEKDMRGVRDVKDLKDDKSDIDK